MSDETITTTAAERRLGGALMWTGALLGAMFIAVLGLGFLYYTTAMSPTGIVPTLTKDKAVLQEKLDVTTKSLATTEQNLRDAKKEIEALKAEAAKKPGAPKPRPAPTPVNPF
jgi:hypothetical protein